MTLVIVLLLLLVNITIIEPRTLNRSEIVSYIIGGRYAKDGEVPWQVSLWRVINKDDFYCGGSILSDQWILTAAHCIYKKEPK